jgi:hypothetical protein
MRTLTGYAIAVLVILVVINGVAWAANASRLHGVMQFSAGFALGMLGMYLAAKIYGYRKVAGG